MNRQLKTLLLVLVASLAFVTTTQAQSGRRRTTPEPAAPVPTPTPHPTPKPKQESKSDLVFIVGVDQSDSFNSLPLTYYSTVMNACAERLRHNSSATVNTASQLTRSEAIKKAKSEKTTYVVYLRFTGISMSNSSNQEAELEFIVYAPTTAKVATSGRSYKNSNRKGPIVVQPPGGSGNIVYEEQLLRRAAEDAADRILKSLHIVMGNYSASE